MVIRAGLETSTNRNTSNHATVHTLVILAATSHFAGCTIQLGFILVSIISGTDVDICTAVAVA
jgi:hypothetical protein